MEPAPLTPPRPMLAFDIETTGLNRYRDRITCACAYDPDRGIAAKFIFRTFIEPGSGGEDDPEAFMRLLDEAPTLSAFNGVNFDIPFICAHWRVHPARAGGWARKLVDVFHTCKKGIDRTFSLNALLDKNALGSKNGCGGNALVLAREERWDELAEYCLHDCVKTWEVTTLPTILLPFRPEREEPGWVLEGLRFVRNRSGVEHWLTSGSEA